eukprot:8550003-Karenia_brevis.AAC.1
MDVEEIDKLEQETGQVGENTLTMMLTHIYHTMWKGSKEAMVKAMIAEAKVGEIPAILKFAETVPELAPIPEWPGTMPPIPEEEGGASALG